MYQNQCDDDKAITLRFENEYELHDVMEEIYYIFHDAYSKTAIEEAEQMILEFEVMEEE